MGIERSTSTSPFGGETIDLQKESPSMGIESIVVSNTIQVPDCLAKRVPKHGD